jgi:hypothetical protein
MVLPSDWAVLTPQEQLFVVIDLERTARGLAPLEAMSTVLDSQATDAAANGRDPDPGALPVSAWGAVWGDGYASALEVDYEWMYDDGPGSPNEACPRARAPGCWGHRHNILLDLPCAACVAGVGFQNTDNQGLTAWTAILVEATGPTEVGFTWKDVVASGR